MAHQRFIRIHGTEVDDSDDDNDDDDDDDIVDDDDEEDHDDDDDDDDNEDDDGDERGNLLSPPVKRPISVSVELKNWVSAYRNCASENDY